MFLVSNVIFLPDAHPVVLLSLTDFLPIKIGLVSKLKLTIYFSQQASSGSAGFVV